MIEITIRLKPGRALHFAALLRTAADLETDPGQAKHYRGAARHIERLPKSRTLPRRRPGRPTPTRPASGPRPIRYTPRVQRPRHPGIDESAVQCVVLNVHPLPVLSRAEARLACWHLTGRGYSAAEIADRLQVAQRTINRWRAEDRQAVTTR
ncbi:hypothetical protein [Streptomyces sp. STR69]|uniref:hypothetical protein n=1 Tax=Streptomyces sp. STR69 TaxID=1796942 RepID=UPI0021CADCFB|nr:hypothetical protein [Streptomyces sp. STR69]